MSDPANTRQLVELLTKYVQSTDDFITAQAPAVLQELILWQYISCALSLGLLVAACLALRFTSRRLGKVLKDAEAVLRSDEVPWFIGTALCGVCLVAATISFVFAAILALQAYFTPKLFLLQHLRSLL
jgi:hypothetical protein